MGAGTCTYSSPFVTADLMLKFGVVTSPAIFMVRADIRPTTIKTRRLSANALAPLATKCQSGGQLEDMRKAVTACASSTKQGTRRNSALTGAMKYRVVMGLSWKLGRGVLGACAGELGAGVCGLTNFPALLPLHSHAEPSSLDLSSSSEFAVALAAEDSTS